MKNIILDDTIFSDTKIFGSTIFGANDNPIYIRNIDLDLEEFDYNRLKHINISDLEEDHLDILSSNFGDRTVELKHGMAYPAEWSPCGANALESDFEGRFRTWMNVRVPIWSRPKWAKRIYYREYQAIPVDAPCRSSPE